MDSMQKKELLIGTADEMLTTPMENMDAHCQEPCDNCVEYYDALFEVRPLLWSLSVILERVSVMLNEPEINTERPLALLQVVERLVNDSITSIDRRHIVFM